MRFTSLNSKKLVLLGLTAGLAAFTGPQKDDLIELKGFLYGRSASQFRTSDQNKITVLKPGTHALIKETKYFTDTKNYGMCLEVKSADNSAAAPNCVWVYYNVNNPNMTLYSVAQDPTQKEQILKAWASEKPQTEKSKITAGANETPSNLKVVNNPEQASAAVPTRPVTAVIEASPVAKKTAKAAKKDAAKTAKKEAVDSSAADSAKATASLALGEIDQFNRKSSDVMTKSDVAPSPACPDGKCNTHMAVYQKCDSSNGYLEPAFAEVMKGHSGFFQSSQKEIIRTQCIQRNLVTNGSGRYKTCDSSSRIESKRVKACISENYVTITSKAFNLAADCFGSLKGGGEVSKKQLALSVFSLMAQESGMHVNVLSPTDAGGPGQFTGSAIADINGRLKTIRSQLSSNPNPQCSQILSKVFEKPMSASNTCDRIAVSKDNPLKNIAYTFAYQTVLGNSLESAYFKSKTFIDLVSHLSAEQSARLKFSLAAWAHNTGPGGMQNALRSMLRESVRQHSALHSKADVDHFLASLKNHMHTKENKFFYSNIQTKVSAITKEPTSCLAD